MQQVLGYSAIRAGLAFLVIAVGMIVSSAAGQHLVTRVGVKVVLAGGLLGFAVAQGLFIRLPVAGSYAAHLLPGFVLVAAALGMAFVGDFIASATGVEQADAGLASGLINTSQQIGGAIGLAVTTTIAASRTAALLHTGHRPAVALTVGFHGAFAVCGALAIAAAAIVAILIPRTRQPGPGTPLAAATAPSGANQPPPGAGDDN
jgi:predicted MFS family arabinose efflux permease